MPGNDIRSDDVLVIWNRYGHYDALAKRFQRVIVSENGYLGRDWLGQHWYSLALGHHNGAGVWPDDGPQRWESWGVELAPWRAAGREIVALATRGIGPDGVREPPGWLPRTIADVSKRTGLPVRIRRHPGERSCVPLDDDLRKAAACLTWGSGAALKALALGVPVIYGFPKWIGASAATPVGSDLANLFMGDRVPMFSRLAWAMWNTDEIASGEAFARLLSPSTKSKTTTDQK